MDKWRWILEKYFISVWWRHKQTIEQLEEVKVFERGKNIPNLFTVEKGFERMDFHSVMETFAEAWVAANTQTPLTEAAEAQGLSLSPANIGIGLNSSNSLGELFDRREHDGLIEIGSRAPIVRSPIHSPEHRFGGKFYSNLSSLNHSKSIPVHTIIEQVQGTPHTDNTAGLQPTVELDSYAIVPTTIRFNELVRTALLRLGYSAAETVSAKGAIQIKNWKQLSFEQITDMNDVTVGEILGELSNVATLYIRLYSMPENPQEWTDTAVRNAVLVLLREMSQSKLASLCPLSQPLLSNIMNNKYNGKIGKDKCQEFGSWYLNYCKKDNVTWPPNATSTGCPRDGRLTFHPIKELPMLKEWYQSNRSPSHATLQMYVDILNQGTVRQQERPKVTTSSLKNWWKNERQRERKSVNGGLLEKKKRRRSKKQNGELNKCKEETNGEK
ncbi:homeobox protein dve-1-like isoform X2 [Centruroides vittatus]|uniref:homeobox protein dve-1-like isoform X2 n=1 Tax=Centruroides vittatus TaxID=120091 RepID=UPI003510653F